jgi:hypothetical protein
MVPGHVDGLTVGGWISLVLSNVFVIALMAFCFWRVLAGNASQPRPD